MKKYPIDKQFGIFRIFKPPVYKAILPLASAFLASPPPFLFKDKELKVREIKIPSFDSYPLTVYEITPINTEGELPCLMNFHGGGFVFEGAFHHYRLAMEYARRGGCKVFYVRYRLSPKNKFPVPMEDCYAATRWVYDNAESLGVDKNRIAVSGDSAGGTLSAAVCHMNRDRGNIIPISFQLLVYPFLDMRNNSESCRKYKSTPMWNSRLSEKVKPMIMNENPENYHYISLVESSDFSSLPDAYIETAEFDCLHDDGILYAELLRGAGNEVTLKETTGTMHGFDIALNAPVSKRMIEERAAYIKKAFNSVTV